MNEQSVSQENPVSYCEVDWRRRWPVMCTMSHVHLHTICACMCKSKCVCWRGPVRTSSLRGLAVTEIQNRHAPGPCACTETDVVYMIKCLLKRLKEDRQRVRIKSRGQQGETEWKRVWQKQANSVKKKGAQESLTDRKVRIIDSGSDRESMWWWDNKQIDVFCHGERGWGRRVRNTGLTSPCYTLVFTMERETKKTLKLTLENHPLLT